jgi:hypothetical protein
MAACGIDRRGAHRGDGRIPGPTPVSSTTMNVAPKPTF